MISALIAVRDRNESKRLLNILRDVIAKLTDGESRIQEAATNDEQCSFLGMESLLDLLLADVTDENSVRSIRRFRSSYPEVRILIIADQTTPPGLYIRPGIQPSAVILRPYEEENACRAVEEFTEEFLESEHRTDQDGLVIETRDGITRIPYEAIYCIEASMKKIAVRLRTEEICYYDTMDQLMKRLPEQFFRCHRGYIVNGDKVKRYNASEMLLEMIDGSRIPVARSYRSEIRDRVR